MSFNNRFSADPSRNGAALADYETVLPEADHAEVAAQVGLVLAAPGPALLVWGPDAIVLAYNRAYRLFAGHRASVVERPLFKAQPELERAWRARLDQALGGVSAVLEPSDCALTPSTHDSSSRSSSLPPPMVAAKPAASAGDVRCGWILPVGVSAGVAKGALILLMDVTPVVESLRRAVALVAVDLRDSLVGVRVLSERLSRAPKITPDRFVGDVGRILEMTAGMERTADDMTAFARFAGGSGAQINPRAGDLSALVRAACDELVAQSEQANPRPAAPSAAPSHPAYEGPTSVGRPRAALDGEGGAPARHTLFPEAPSRSTSGSMFPPPSGPVSPRTSGATSWLHVNTVYASGSWDPDAIHRIVVNLVAAARRYGVDGGEVDVEVQSGREGAALVVRAEGRAPREDEMESLFEPWKRSAPPSDRRRVGSGLGLFVARELVIAHGGRLSWDQVSPSSFALRVVLPR